MLEVDRIVEDFGRLAATMDGSLRYALINTVLRWWTWQDYHMPNEVTSVRDDLLAAIAQPRKHITEN